MTYKEFLGYNKKYRMITEWTEDLSNTEKDTAFIYGYNGKIKICLKTPNIIQVQSFCSINFHDKIKEKYNIEVNQFGENGEYTIEFDVKHLDLIIDEFSPKRAPLQPVPPHSVRNINLWLRHMRNIDKKYQNILNERLKGGQDE